MNIVTFLPPFTYTHPDFYDFPIRTKTAKFKSTEIIQIILSTECPNSRPHLNTLTNVFFFFFFIIICNICHVPISL